VNAYLHGVHYYLPEIVRTNDDLVKLNPTWNADQIFRRTGIRQRRIARPEESSGDMAVKAAENLFRESPIDRKQVDVLIFCSQSADYYIPATGCVLQRQLALSNSCAAFDLSLGCSGFTYGLWMARSLILGGAARNVLLITSDKMTQYCNDHDMVTAAIFGDGAGASLVSAQEEGAFALIGPSVLGTDGRGAESLIVPAGGSRCPRTAETGQIATDATGNTRSKDQLFMDGTEVFNFTLSAVPAGIRQLLAEIKRDKDEIGLFLLHQANGFMLDALRRGLKVKPEQLPIDIADIGNTTCASIPILIRRVMDRGQFAPGMQCVLAGFGVGYSWAMTSLTVQDSFRMAPPSGS
jgi:3-oxoacyl-[acyl-carrier-protein] synthase III